MYFVGSLARFGGYRNNTSVSTPRAPGWVTFFATVAQPRNIHLDRALGGCQHERNINGRADRGPVSIFLTNRRESLHQQQSPAPSHSCSLGKCFRECGHQKLSQGRGSLHTDLHRFRVRALRCSRRYSFAQRLGGGNFDYIALSIFSPLCSSFPTKCAFRKSFNPGVQSKL